jgi:hypothetical protein
MVERRKHERYLMPRGIFAIIRSASNRLQNYSRMSIGEIAMVLYKSKPESMGQIRNVSFGGIAFDCNNTDVSQSKNVQLDVLMAEQGIYLHDLPYAVVPLTSGKRKTKGKKVKFRSNALRFGKLTPEQKGRLQQLLTFHIS